MKEKLETIENWGKIFLILNVIGTIILTIFSWDIDEEFGIMTFAICIVECFIVAFALKIINVKLEMQNIVIEQNKEIIKLLSK